MLHYRVGWLLCFLHPFSLNFFFRMVWLLVWGHRTINYLSDVPEQGWRVVKSKEKQ